VNKVARGEGLSPAHPFYTDVHIAREAHRFTFAVQALHGNMTRAAEVLEIDRRTLYRLLERFDVKTT
jgi:transcriptional regulator of acetoin/glycerol metabolism